MEKLGGEDGCCFDGVGSVVEPALVSWGFACLGSLCLGRGEGLPLAPHCSSRQGVLEEPLVQIHPNLGPFAFQQSRLVHAQGMGQFLHGVGRGTNASAAGLEAFGRGTAASLGAWRGGARQWQPCWLAPCPPPCFPHLVCVLVPGWGLEMPMLSGEAPPASHSSQHWSLPAGCDVLLCQPCPAVPCIPGTAAALLRHGWSGRTRGLTLCTISGFRVS